MNETEQKMTAEDKALAEQNIQTPAQQDPAGASAPGQQERKSMLLKTKRLEQGLSLEAVHETTKIPLDALKAIEEDYTIGTLSPFYIRGFVKIYAKYLNIDVNEVLEDYQKEELPEVTKQEVDTDFEFKVKQTLKKYLTHQRRKQIATVLGVLLFCFLLFQLITFMTRSIRKRSQKKTAAVTVNKTPAAVAPVSTQTNRPPAAAAVPKPPKAEAPKPAVVAPKPKPPVQKTQKPKPPVAAPVVTAAPVEVAQKDIRLTVRALKDSWLRVKADDRTVFQSTLAKGAVETWQADEEIIIKGKNIIHLEFELNGKMIGSLGRKNRKAKSVTFTKDGLSVAK